MNREQRRKAEKQKKHIEKQRLTDEQAKAVRDLIKEQRIDAMQHGLYVFEMLCKLVLHDKFGFGTGRLKKWSDAMKTQLDCIKDDRVKLRDIEIEIEKIFRVKGDVDDEQV